MRENIICFFCSQAGFKDAISCDEDRLHYFYFLFTGWIQRYYLLWKRHTSLLMYFVPSLDSQMLFVVIKPPLLMSFLYTNWINRCFCCDEDTPNFYYFLLTGWIHRCYSLYWTHTKILLFLFVGWIHRCYLLWWRHTTR